MSLAKRVKRTEQSLLGRKCGWECQKPSIYSFNRVLEEASASQAGSRKESRLESSGKNKSYDVRIENFDVSFGDR